jgi:esterase/lipase
MEILEFGNKENKKTILIHGFQLIWQYWEKHIEYFKKNYHVIVPIITGHNQNQKETFISFKETAKEIEDYCINNFGYDIYAVFGMSMGGVVAANLLQNKRLKIKKLFAMVRPLYQTIK